MAQTHRIKRLDVELRVSDQEAARDLQQEVSTFCRSELHELLQGTFDAVAPDRLIRIDRLELSLPAFRNADEFREKLGERIRQALQTQLAEAEAATAGTASGAMVGDMTPTPRIIGAPYQAADVFIHILKYGVAPWHAMALDFDAAGQAVIALLQTDRILRNQLAAVLSASGPAARRFILQTQPSDRRRIVARLMEIDESLLADVERLLDSVAAVLTRKASPEPPMDLVIREIFLRNLLWRWTMDNAVLGSMLDEVMAALIDAAGDNTRRILEDLPLAAMEIEAVVPRRWRPVIRDRIAAYASPGSVYQQAGSASSGQEAIVDQTASRLAGGELSGAPPGETAAGRRPDDSAISAGRNDDIPARQALPGQDLLGGAAREASATGAPASAERSFKGRAKDPQAMQDERQSSVRPGKTEAVSPEPSGSSREAAGQAPEWFRRDAGSTDHHGVTPDAAGRERVKTARPLDLPEARTDPAAGLPWMTPYEAEEFHITNAGLVLVAPFFGTVFRDLGYVTLGRGFVTEAARVRAVHFSQYLVTSEQHPTECRLTLNKILCGMEVDQPLERFIDLTAPEHDAAREVLESALAHWTVLKRTSAPVFQQTFLQHEGILTQHGGHWLLRIERISADVLIDTLPWTISIIKHPWMKQPVMVEW